MLLKVGSAQDVPAGQMRAFDVGGTGVTVANADGHLYAFDDRCTHTGCSLANGTLTGYAGGIERKQTLLEIEQDALF